MERNSGNRISKYVTANKLLFYHKVFTNGIAYKKEKLKNSIAMIGYRDKDIA